MRRGHLRVAAALTLLCAMAMSACDEPAEGCLDYRAVDVDFAALEACQDCCVYPGLRLQVIRAELNADTVTRTLGTADTLLTSAGELTVEQVAFYLHDLRLELADGRELPLADTLTTFAPDGAALLREGLTSVLRIERLPASPARYGELRDTGEVVALRARFGLTETLLQLDPAAQYTSSPLGVGTGRLVDTATQVPYELAARWTLAGQPDSLFSSAAAERELRYELPVGLELGRGRSVVVTLAPRLAALADVSALADASARTEAFVERVLAQAVVAEATLQR